MRDQDGVGVRVGRLSETFHLGQRRAMSAGLDELIVPPRLPEALADRLRAGPSRPADQLENGWDLRSDSYLFFEMTPQA